MVGQVAVGRFELVSVTEFVRGIGRSYAACGELLRRFYHAAAESEMGKGRWNLFCVSSHAITMTILLPPMAEMNLSYAEPLSNPGYSTHHENNSVPQQCQTDRDWDASTVPLVTLRDW